MSIISLFPARIYKGAGRGGAMKEQERILTWLALGSLSGTGEMVKLVPRCYSQNALEAPILGPLRQLRQK